MSASPSPTSSATSSATPSATASPSHWRLTGPWYRWPRPGLPEDGRLAAPAIQMFAGADFMAQFLARPQHSLRYDEVVDVVQGHDLVKAGKLPGRLATLMALDSQGEPVNRKTFSGDVFRARPAPGLLRKLYQPTHDRHYLLTCELHCEVPGFPRVDRKQVCQAGFVLRRRRSIVPPGVTAAANEFVASQGWLPFTLGSVSYTAGSSSATLHLDRAPVGQRLRLTVLGAGPTPLLGATLIAAGAPSPESDGRDLSSTLTP